MKYLVFLCLVLLGCNKPVGKYETWRPHYHFTPERNWTNDPNGLLYSKGEYHLFYQHNPFGNRWGHMSWGHAVSKDLLHWEHLPVAIGEYTDANGDSVMIFSGSAVNDGDSIAAIYTSHIHKAGNGIRQNQSLAYSSDNGRTFTRYANNPVLDINRKDFRDPKVFWHEPKQKWVLAAVVPDKHKVQLYQSKDLKSWELMSEFGPLGDTTKIWECPDLFRIPLESDPSGSKWMMVLSNSHPQGGPFVGMQYFVGDFDGNTFTADSASQYPLYVDYGKDFYAAITFNDAPNDKPVLLGWVNNWAYANDLPTTPWKGAMSLPRELSLFDSPDGLRLRQRPAIQLDTVSTDELSGSAYIEIELDASAHDSKIGVKLFNDIEIGFDGATQKVFVDRRQSKNTGFHPSFASIEHAPARIVNGKIYLSVYVDQSIVEVFVNDGEAVITDLFFPGESHSIEPIGKGGVTWRAWNIREL